MTTIVRLDGVGKSFDSTRALAEVELSVESGEMFALVGPDGAGKTTLLRILAGVLRHDEGSVEVLGRQLPTGRRDIKRRIGYLSQGFSLYGDLSIDENLAFFAEIYGVSRYHGRREELLEFTRLKPFRNRLSGALSGGMKKKLALACALIHRPELILLDEPTTGVDPVSRRDFWVILGELTREGLTIIFATPYLDEAERCDRVGLLDRGRFLTVGPPEEIKRQVPGRIYEVVTSQPRRAQAVVKEQGFMNLIEMQAQGDKLYLRLDETDVPRNDGASVDTARQIREFFSRANVPVESVRESSPTLENLFISLITRENR